MSFWRKLEKPLEKFSEVTGWKVDLILHLFSPDGEEFIATKNQDGNVTLIEANEFYDEGQEEFGGEELAQKPTITLDLNGPDGNAFVILQKAKQALIEASLEDQVKPMMDEAMSGDYDHLLATVREYVEVL